MISNLKLGNYVEKKNKRKNSFGKDDVIIYKTHHLSAPSSNLV